MVSRLSLRRLRCITRFRLPRSTFSTRIRSATWIIVQTRRVNLTSRSPSPIPLVLAARTAAWPFAVSKLNKSRAQAWFLVLPLVKPRLVVLAGWVVSLIAGGAVGMAADMQGLSPSFVLLATLLPILVHGAIELRQPSHRGGLSLMVNPRDGWVLKSSTRTLPKTLEWGSRHFLGLTLSLKTISDQYGKGSNQTFTVWRWAVSSEDYRRLCVMFAWFIRQPSSCFPGETQ